MPELYSRDLPPQELRRRSGDMLQFGGVTPMELSDGRGRGVRTLLFRTGRLTFQVLVDRGMDISWCDFEGRPLGWMSATGITGPQYYEPEGLSWLRSFYGGLLETCGLANIGLPSVDGAREYGLHGRIGNAPAERLSYGTYWGGDDYVLWAQGTLREAIVFGEELTLTRRLEARLGGATIIITDIVENEGWQSAPYLLLYHVNAGYPVLDEASRLHLRSAKVIPRTAQAEAGLNEWQHGSTPRAGWVEHVYAHQVQPRSDGWVTAALVNPALDDGQGLALAVHYQTAELPYFWQWRMVGQGVYVMGLEPSNSGLRGRKAELDAETVRVLQPGERVTHRLELEGARGATEIQRLISRADGAPVKLTVRTARKSVS
jgi:hypothetical protein